MTLVSLKHLVSFTHHPTLKIKHNSEAESAAKEKKNKKEKDYHITHVKTLIDASQVWASTVTQHLGG